MAADEPWQPAAWRGGGSGPALEAARRSFERAWLQYSDSKPHRPHVSTIPTSPVRRGSERDSEERRPQRLHLAACALQPSPASLRYQHKKRVSPRAVSLLLFPGSADSTLCPRPSAGAAGAPRILLRYHVQERTVLPEGAGSGERAALHPGSSLFTHRLKVVARSTSAAVPGNLSGAGNPARVSCWAGGCGRGANCG